MAKRIVLVVVLLLIGIQFVRPARNISTVPAGPNDFLVKFSPPTAVRDALSVACYDCHSNNTRYPWYNQVQPVRWWLASHISDGKRELNLSEFGTYTAKKQARKIDAMSDQITNREMPLKSYTWIHRDAHFTDEQIRTISAWLDDLHDKVAPAE